MNIWQRSSQVITLATICLFLAALPTSAAVTERPDAGTTLGGLKDRKQPPKKPASEVEVAGEKKDIAPVPTGPKIKLNGIRITGQDLTREDKLLPLVSDAFGQELSFGELEALAGRISKYFRDQGYIAAAAYLPPQEIRDGVVEIRVIVGQYGKIDIRNHSTLLPDTAAAIFANLKSGDYITGAPLERTLLILNDTSGISAKATLTPGVTPGTADLIVELKDASRISGQIYADNWGNRFTGKTRTGVSININNPSGRGDTATIGGVYTGAGMSDYNLSYLLPVDGQGTRLGVSYSSMRYSLGEEFASLRASGLAKTASIFGTFVFDRSRSSNLSARIGFDSKRLQDRIDTTSSDSRKRSSVWTLGLSGDSRDKFGGGGLTAFGLTLTAGKLTLESADAEVNDFMARTAGSYGKTNLRFSRQQYVTDRLSLHLSFSGQKASKNLDSSEKFSIGGASGVRAYPQGEAPGDEGYLFTGELRWSLPTPKFQLAAFYDNGKSIINKKPWDNSVNKRTLTGAGFGLIWNGASDLSVRLDYAWKLSSDPATADTDKNGRLWLLGVKYF